MQALFVVIYLTIMFITCTIYLMYHNIYKNPVREYTYTTKENNVNRSVVLVHTNRQTDSILYGYINASASFDK